MAKRRKADRPGRRSGPPPRQDSPTAAQRSEGLAAPPLPLGVRCGRLASRLGFQAALLVSCAMFCRELYRHFAHTKYYAMWIVVSFGIAGAIAGWRTGSPPGAEERRLARVFRFGILAVLFTWCLSLMFAINVGHGFEVLCRVMPLLAVAWWAAQRPLSWRRDIPRLVGLMFAVTTLVLFLGLLQWEGFQTWLQSKPRMASWHTFFTRDIGMLSHRFWLATLGNKNSAASFYAAALALMCATALLDRSPTRRAIAVTLGTLLVIVIIKTTSRGGLVATGAGVAAAGLAALQCEPARRRATSLLVPSIRLLIVGAAALAAGALLAALLAPLHRTDPSGWEVGTSPGKLLLMGSLILAAGGLVLTVSGLLLLAWHFLMEWAFAPLMRLSFMQWRWSQWRRGAAVVLRWSATVVLIVGVVLWIGWLAWLSGIDAERIQQHDEMWSNLWAQVFSEHGGKSFIERLYIWQSAARMVRDHPVTGIGWAQFPLVYPSYTWPEYYDNWGPTDLITTEEAHSGHLNLTVETGLLGAAAWMLLLGTAWFGAIRRMRWASAGDPAARAALIWFPPAAAMAVHMSVDKFWAYPASLTIMMFGFGILVRPHRTTGGDPVFPRRAGIVWAAGLVVALLLSISASQLASGSHALARGRQLSDQAKAYHRAMVNELRSTGRTSLAERTNLLSRQAEEVLENARTLAPWEIDAWSRSLDHILAMNLPEDSRSIGFLESAIRVSPNYFPVQRNYAAYLMGEARRREHSNPEVAAELMRLSEELLENVLSLKPNELSALYTMSDLLLNRDGPGDREEAEQYLRTLVTVPRIHPLRHQVLDAARVRLAQLLVDRGEHEEALALMTLASQHAVGVNELALWRTMTDTRIALGRFEEAWQGLAGHLGDLTPQQRAALAPQAQADPSNVPDRGLLIILNLASENPTRAMQLAATWAGQANTDSIWGFAAVIARIAAEDLGQENLPSQIMEIWENRFPDSTLRASAELQLVAE